MRHANIALALILIGAFAAPAGAQQPDTDYTLPSVLRRAAAERWQVRLTAIDSSMVQGRVWKVDPDSALIGEVRVQQAKVAMVERMHRDNSGLKRGALIGGAVTAAVLGTFGAALCDNCGDATRIYVTTGLVGAVIFGTMGALVDPGEPSWRVVWRRARE